jgi:rhodanese-related sulfurtransferase
MKQVSRDEVKQVIDNKENTILVEALPEKDYREAHIPGAVSLPADKVEELAPKLLKNKDQQIITYCASKECQASIKAAEALEGLGYSNVADYRDGKADWKEAGLPLESSVQGISGEATPS